MLLVCPHCAKSYEVASAAIGPGGRSVRCTRCRTVFFAEAPLAKADVSDEAAVPAESPGASAETFGGEETFESTAADGFGDDRHDFDKPPSMAFEDREIDGGDDMQALIDGPSIVPQDSETRSYQEGQGPFPITGGDIAIFAQRRARNRAKRQFKLPLPKFRWPLAPMPTAILILGTIALTLVVCRTQIVRLAPQTASLYSKIGLGVNLRGLDFEDIKVSREMHDGIPVLTVEGDIVSVAGTPVEVPRLRFAVRNRAGNEIYSWTAMAPRGVAEPGESIPFRSRLASPPAEAHDIAVRFYNRRDASAALR